MMNRWRWWCPATAAIDWVKSTNNKHVKMKTNTNIDDGTNRKIYNRDWGREWKRDIMNKMNKQRERERERVIQGIQVYVCFYFSLIIILIYIYIYIFTHRHTLSLLWT